MLYREFDKLNSHQKLLQKGSFPEVNLTAQLRYLFTVKGLQYFLPPNRSVQIVKDCKTSPLMNNLMPCIH